MDIFWHGKFLCSNIYEMFTCTIPIIISQIVMRIMQKLASIFITVVEHHCDKSSLQTVRRTDTRRHLHETNDEITGESKIYKKALWFGGWCVGRPRGTRKVEQQFRPYSGGPVGTIPNEVLPRFLQSRLANSAKPGHAIIVVSESHTQNRPAANIPIPQ